MNSFVVRKNLIFLHLFYVSGDFTIDANSGEIRTVNKLQRDLGYQYNLTIKAVDHGTPQLSATVSFVEEVKLCKIK